MNSKKYLITLFLFITFLSPLMALEKVALQLQWKHQFEFAGFYAAKEKGFYQKAGLDVELRELTPGTNITGEVLSGRADYAVSSSKIVVDRAKGKQVVMLANYFKHSPFVLVTHPDIKSPSDLKGHKIMAETNEFLGASLVQMLNLYGVGLSDIRLVPHTFTVDPFVNQEVVASTAFRTNELFKLNELGIDYNVIDPAQFGIDYYDVILFTSEKTVENHEERTADFISASNQGWQYALENPDEIIDLILQKYNSQNKSRAALKYEANAVKTLIMPDLFPIGSIDPVRIRQMLQSFKASGLLKKESALDLDHFLFDNYANNRVPLLKALGLNEKEIRFIQDNPVIRVANELDWPPFDYNENGTPKGYSIDVVKILLSKIGVTPVFVYGHGWKSLLAMFKEKKLDILPALYKTKERLSYTAFTEPYYSSEATLVMPADASIQSGEIPQNARISTVKGEGVNAILPELYPKSEIVYYDTYLEQLRSLFNRDDDLAYGHPLVMKYYAKNKLLNDIKIHSYATLPSEYVAQLHLGVRKDWEILAEILDKVKTRISDREWSALRAKWTETSYGAPSSSRIELSSSERQFVQSQPQIIFGTEESWAPWVISQADGSLKGLDVDYINLINEMTGLNIKLITGFWDDMVEKAKKREIDGLSTSAVHPERAKYFNFTNVYSQSFQGLFVHQKNLDTFNRIEKLAGKKVGYIAGNLFLEKMLKSYPEIIRVPVKDDLDGHRRVVEEKLDGYLGSLHSGVTKMKPRFAGVSDLATIMTNHPINLVFSVRNDQPELTSIINKALKAIPRQKHDELFYKWHQIEHPESHYVKLTQKEKNFLSQNPVITLGDAANWPPYIRTREDGQLEGIVPDYVEKINTLTGANIKLQTGKWGDMVKKAEAYEIDGLSESVALEERRKFFEFTMPYFRDYHVVVQAQHKPEMASLEELNGKTVAVMKGAKSYLKMMEPIPNLTIKEFETEEEAYKAVATRRADAAITLITNSQAIEKQYLGYLKIGYVEVESPLEIVMSIRKDWPELVGIINKAIDAIPESEHVAIFKRWVGTEPATSSQVKLTQKERSFINQNPTLKIGYDADWLPMEAQDENGVYIGMASEILKLLSERIGISFEFVTHRPWKKVLEKAKNGEIDALSMLAPSEERREYLHFTQPYFTFPAVIISRDDSDLLGSMNELDDRAIGVVNGYFTHDLLKEKYPDIKTVTFGNITEGLKALSDGEIDYFYENISTANYYMKLEGIENLKVALKTPHDFEFSMGVSRQVNDHETLVRILNKGLLSIDQSVRDATYNRWVNLPVRQKIDYELIWKIVLGAVVLVFGFFVWNRRLMAEIDKRKEAELQLEHARQKAIEASKAKGDFLANMSHEIRTPMNAIIGMSNLALKKEMPDEIRTYLKKIHLSGQSLLDIINDILDFSKIEAGKIEIEAALFSLEDTLRQVVTVFEPATQEKGIGLNLDYDSRIPEYLLGDSVRIKQVVTNFTSNAIKFTPQGSVTIKTRFISQTPDNVLVRIEVQDTGKGIAIENQNKLFEEFTQEDVSTTRTHGGTGLGLSISKKLTELMGGQIGLESEPGQGSTFFIQLELGIAREIELKESVLLTPDIGKARILVVDDDKRSRDILLEIMENFSFQIDEASNPETAIELIKQASPEYDLLLIDYKMPQMSGAELYSKIQTDSEITHKPKAVMISVFDDSKIAQEARKAGIKTILRKPVDASDLLIGIIQALGKQAAIKGKASTVGLDPDQIRFKEQEILLVEDNEINQEVAKEMLTQVHLNVTVANNGQEAVNLIKNNPSRFQLVLMDLQMPIMDGYTATRQIRQLETAPRIPIVALSADAISGTKKKVIASGMNDYTTKPIQPESLMWILTNYLDYEITNQEDVSEAIMNAQSAQEDKNDLGVEALLNIEGIDYEAGLKKLMNNKRVYHKMLVQFASSYNDFIDKCLKSLEEADFDALGQQLHAFKGVAGNLSANELYALSQDAEKLAKSQDPDCQRLLKIIQQKLQETSTSILGTLDQTEKKSESHIAKPTLSNEALQEMLEKIAPMLKEGDTEVENLINELLEFELDDTCMQTLLNAQDMIQGYDFDSALEEINQLRGKDNG